MLFFNHTLFNHILITLFLIMLFFNHTLFNHILITPFLIMLFFNHTLALVLVRISTISHFILAWHSERRSAHLVRG